MKRVALGLSGGVDSAVAAHLLRQLEYEVHCIYLNCFDKDVPGCRTKEDRKDALAVALHLGLSFQVLDFRKQYQASVIDYFKREYEAGRTPNPDVVCNRDIKFGLFYKWAIEEQGFDYLATGHYADVPRFFLQKKSAGTPASRKLDTSEREAGSLRLKREFYRDAAPVLRTPRDLHKDQTYFLWQVPRERFERVLFPLGDYLKSEVREIAREEKLPVADKPDSTGICFIGEVRVEEFLKRLGVKEKEGEVVMKEKSSTSSTGSTSRDDFVVIGHHKGVIFYTIGQRHGFEINPKSEIRNPKQSNQNFNDQNLKHSDLENSNLFRASNLDIRVSPKDRPPLYVIEKDIAHNRLVVGFGAACYRSQFSCGQLNWMIDDQWLMDYSSINHHPSSIIHCFVRIRHGGELIQCSLEMVDGRWLMDKRSSIIHYPSSIRVRLREPQRGIAPGQSAVFYSQRGVVLGGGVIQ